MNNEIHKFNSDNNTNKEDIGELQIDKNDIKIKVKEAQQNI
jgi:hypothetical protein